MRFNLLLQHTADCATACAAAGALLFFCAAATAQDVFIPQPNAANESQSCTYTDAEKANNEGMLLLEQGNNAKAEEYFRCAVNGNAGFAAAYNNLAASLMRQKRYEEACPFLEKAISINPQHVKAISNMAIALFHCGKYRTAYEWYCRAKAQDEAYVKVRFDRKKTIEELNRKKRENPGRSEYGRMTEYLEKNPEVLN